MGICCWDCDLLAKLVIVGDCKDDIWDPGSTTGRLRGGGTGGSSFRILIIFERLAGAVFGVSTAA